MKHTCKICDYSTNNSSHIKDHKNSLRHKKMCTKKKVELKTKSTIQIKNLLDKYDVIYDTDEKDDLIDLYVGYLEHIKESSKKKTSIKKRKLINTCNTNFETQYAYTNIDEDEYIHINEILLSKFYFF